MKKISVIFLTLSLNGVIQASYLDDWSNYNLCGWMESASIPEYIKTEVEKIKILCYGGVEVQFLPSEENSLSDNGTVFPSPDPLIINVLESSYDHGVEQTMGSSY